MNTIRIDKKNARMIAHAGLQGLESPNTCAGFVAAGNRSYFGIETDVRVTKDGKIVVIHNSDTEDITGVKCVVEECTLEELQQLLVYDRPFFWDMENYGLQPQEGKFRSDLRIPSLAEYVSICKRYEKVAVLELKSQMDAQAIATVVEEFRRQDYLEHAIFISFFWENLVELRKLAPEQPVQFLTDEKMDFTEEFLDRVVENRFDLDIHIFTTTKELVERLHARGITVNCWTVDWPDKAERVAAWGVDYITTDILE